MLTEKDFASFGVYVCRRCRKRYIVNEPGSWRPCTPEYCHDCVERLALHQPAPKE